MISRLASPRAAFVAAIIACAALLAVDGSRHGLFAQFPAQRALEALLLLGALALAGALLAWRTGSLGFARAAALVCGVLHLVVLGIAPVAATLALAVAGAALGSALVPTGVAARPWLALVVGLGLIAAVAGWLLPAHVHFAGLYALAFALLVAWRRRALVELWHELVAPWRARAESDGNAAFAVLVAATIAATAWLPTLMYDDMSYHLGLPYQLAEWGRYRMDAATQIWALAPWSSDVLHAIAQLLAGSEARGALNLLWLVAALHLLHALARGAGLAGAVAFAAVALAASQPMTASLVLSMHTELPTGAVVLALAVLVQGAVAANAARVLPAVAALAGTALALKVSALVFVLPLLGWFAWRSRTLSWRLLPAALVLFVLAGGSSYAYSAWFTGNPVLPLFNDVFASPFYRVQRLADPNFRGLLDWALPLHLATDSGRYNAGWNGVAGFQWLLLLVALPLALRDARLRALVLVGLAAVAVLFAQMQYLRYVWPALVLLSVPLAGTAAHWLGTRAFVRLAGAIALANLAFAANVAWQLREGPWQLALRGDEALLAQMAPERVLAAQLRARGGETHALFVDASAPFAAELAGRGATVSWYDAELAASADPVVLDPDGAEMARVLLDSGSTHAILRPSDVSSGVLRGVEQVARLERRVGISALYRVEHEPLQPAQPSAPDGNGTVEYRHRLEAAGPRVADVEIALRCKPARAAVRVDWLWLGAGAARGERMDYGHCTADETLRFARSLLLAAGTDELVVRVTPGGAPLPAIFDAQPPRVVLRRDLFAEREWGGMRGVPGRDQR